MERLGPAELVVLRSLGMDEAIAYWDALEAEGRRAGKLDAVVRLLALSDLYYLLVRVCKRVDMLNEFAFARCREVEDSPDGHLDLWAREHFKSSIITFGLTIQDILRDPEITFGIFSHTRPIAKAFLRQIMRELEENRALKAAFPDVLWEDVRMAPKWSEDDGIIVRRRTNPNEATIEAWGLVDGQPVSKHFKVLLYDDIVVQASVTTPEMLAKTMARLEESYSLGTTPHGKKRFIGTRWHFNDAYATIRDRGTAAPREHPGREGGTEEGASVYWPEEVHLEKRRDYGPYTYCFPRGTNILLADWSWQEIQTLEAGYEVVGFELVKGGRTKLVRTKVVATSSRIADVNEYRLASGKCIRCTPNHLWWSGRTGTDGHRIYAQLGNGEYQDLKGLVKITDVVEKTEDPWMLESYAWLAGIIDGEGTISPQGQVIITQSNEHNPAVCERLESVLAHLRIQYKIYQRKAHNSHGRNCKASRLYVLAGGRPMKHALISHAILAKRGVMVERGLYGRIGGRYADPVNDKVVSITRCGLETVFSLQTGTGNYIAEGYASKNSAQILLNPKADALQGFRREWLRNYKRITNLSRMNGYILVDAASSKKKGSDFTGMHVVGLNVDKKRYVLDMVRDRLNLKERSDRLFALHRKWTEAGVKIQEVRYERYGLMADIEHLKARMEAENYRFKIVEVGGITSKHDRIKRLIPLFEQGEIWLPETLYVADWQKVPVDLVRSFVEEEYMAFPVGMHEDLLDALARMEEPDLKLIWPRPERVEPAPPPPNIQYPATAWMA